MQFPAAASAPGAAAAAAAAAEPSPARYVVRLAGEVDEDELVDEIGLAEVAWLRETGLATTVAQTQTPAAAAAEPSHARCVVHLSGDVAEADVMGATGIAGLNWLLAGPGESCSPYDAIHSLNAPVSKRPGGPPPAAHSSNNRVATTASCRLSDL